MDPRRPSRVIDPKVRHVGFFTSAPSNPDRPIQTPTPPVSSMSPSGNSLSPVMIPPPLHADNISRTVSVPVPNASSALRPRRTSMDNESVFVGSYNPADSVLGASPSSSGIEIAGEFSDNSGNWIRHSNSGNVAASSLPGGSLDMTPAADSKKAERESGNAKGGGEIAERPMDLQPQTKPLKEKTTKAERRAMQEAQRAAKAAAKASGEARQVAPSVAPPAMHEQAGKSMKPSQKKDGFPVTSTIVPSEKKGGDRALEKDRKKDAPAPRMQFDDKNRVEKAKKRAVVKQTEAKNRVELFRHLPQYEHGTQLPDLESKFFRLDPMHPAVYKVGLQHLAGDITGGNGRCVSMLKAFQEAIRDYSTPPEKNLTRDLTGRINCFVSFLIECRPLSISMGNAIRFLKSRIAKLPLSLTESEAKASICSDIDRFIREKIVLAAKAIVSDAVTKIRDGDVVLTYGSSSVVEMILLHAHELGKQFRVVVVDSRPKFEGQALLRKLVQKGLSCTYTHINAVSYVIHEVTRVFLGAASVLSNGTVYSRVGTACVAMVAHAFRIPVLICCEAYKFHERVQLDSICSNELGDPDAISKVNRRLDVNYLDDWRSKENLQLLNLIYDVTPSDYVSLIISEYGMIPTTSVPVIVREYWKEHLLI